MTEIKKVDKITLVQWVPTEAIQRVSREKKEKCNALRAS